MMKDNPQISIGGIPLDNGSGAQIGMKSSSGKKGIYIVAQDKGNVGTW